VYKRAFRAVCRTGLGIVGMSEQFEPKMATKPDWLWREAKSASSAGLYGEILPRPSDEPSEFARSIREADQAQPSL
jgi:hypothetical protein